MAFGKVRLTVDGLLHVSSENDDVTNVKSIFKHLDDKIEFDPDVKFEHLFNVLVNESDLVNTVFSSQLGHHKFFKFVDNFQIEKEIPNFSNDNDNVNHIVFGWASFLYDETIDIVLDFYGVGQRDGVDCYFGVDHLPLYYIKKYPLKLDESMKLNDYREGSSSVYDYIIVSKKDITLYDVISCLLYNLSFDGYPPDDFV